LSVLRVPDDLHEAFGFTCSTSTTIRRERELAHLVIQLLFLAGLLAKTDGRNVGVAIGAARNIAVVHRVRVLAAQHVRQYVPLTRALVREHGTTSNVSDGVDAGGGRFHALVGLDESAIRELHAGLV